MTRKQYDILIQFAFKKGTRLVKEAARAFKNTKGYDQTHGRKKEITYLKKELSKYREGYALLKRKIKDNNYLRVVEEIIK